MELKWINASVQMGCCYQVWVVVLLCLGLAFVGSGSGSGSGLGSGAVSRINGTVLIDVEKGVIGRTDNDFVCATLDWWPPQKCDYNVCPWGNSSLLNLDLNNEILINAIRAFSPLKIRLGGSLQDKLIYESEDDKKPCIQFTRNTSELFYFTQGCLPLSRWDQLNTFFRKTGPVVIFGLNALNGKRIQPDGSAVGAWDYSNAKSFISYTVKKNYHIHGWELGNELCGDGVGIRVAADEYASDTISLKNMVEDIYKDVKYKPQIIAPGGFFKADWFKEFIDKTPNSVDAITRHIYNLGAGVDKNLVDHILDPSYLEGEAHTFRELQSILKSSASSAKAWVGESGGAYNSGQNLTSNAFVYSFWYLDQLGMSASYDTKTYCRQSLIGGNYGLLNTINFTPNPDYYSALLWHRLMGRNVLSSSFIGTPKIRAYAHCAKQSNGITVLLINLDNSTTVEAKVNLNDTGIIRGQEQHWSTHNRRAKFIRLPRHHHGLRRYEYHLTAENGNLHSQVMLLNGKKLSVNSAGHIPPLEPIIVDSSKPITIAPYSIVFVHMPYILLPACK